MSSLVEISHCTTDALVAFKNMSASVESPESPTEVVPPAAPVPKTYVYSCRKCRHTLFHHEEIVPHDASVEAKGNKGFTRRGQYFDAHQTSDCTSYFLDPDTSPWVAEESRELHAATAAEAAPVVVDPDTIYCTKCRAKIGSQHWRGSQCSCGAWVTPAFKILAKAIDKLPVWE
jgi:dual specificity phosphatase 12